jgi:hypothetical protein
MTGWRAEGVMLGRRRHDADSKRLDDAEQKACCWRVRGMMLKSKRMMLESKRMMLESKKAEGHDDDDGKSEESERKSGGRKTSSSYLTGKHTALRLPWVQTLSRQAKTHASEWGRSYYRGR